MFDVEKSRQRIPNARRARRLRNAIAADLIAVAVACLTGSRSYAIGVVLAFRLAVTPIVASISALGIVRELMPGVALQALTPSALGDAARQGPAIPMSTAAVAAVLLAWAVAAIALAGWRDVTRDA